MFVSGDTGDFENLRYSFIGFELRLNTQSALSSYFSGNGPISSTAQAAFAHRQRKSGIIKRVPRLKIDRDMATSLPSNGKDAFVSRERGNMLVMIALVGGIIVAVVVIGIGVMMVLFSHQKGRQSADELALTLAQVLNRDDRQGQMNNLVERSRELVYSSRKAYEDCVAEEFHNMEPLMRDLLEESRSGAQSVEKTREALSELTITELRLAQKDFNERLKQAHSLNLNWMKTSQPVVKQLEVGSIDKVNSNVSAPPGFAELRAMDEKSGICDAKTGIYIGNVNAKLPGADADLDFKLSSLAAPVGATVSAARLTDAHVFKQFKDIPLAENNVGITGMGSETGNSGGITNSLQSEQEKRQAQRVDQIPSAVRVRLSVGVSAGSTQTASPKTAGLSNSSNSSNSSNTLQDSLSVTTAATTSGAQPAPDLP